MICYLSDIVHLARVFQIWSPFQHIMLSTGINDGESSLFTLRILLDERKGGAVDLINLLEQLCGFYDVFLSQFTQGYDPLIPVFISLLDGDCTMPGLQGDLWCDAGWTGFKGWQGSGEVAGEALGVLVK